MKTLPNHVIAIDPGTAQSGVCIVRTEDYRPMWCSKVKNESVYSEILFHLDEIGALAGAMNGNVQIVIERMQGNSMPVSSDVFLTCEWIGRFDILFRRRFDGPTAYVYRRDEYKELCANLYSHNDKGVRQSLVDRFAYGEPNYGKGTKKAPGWFYGFAADTWSAYAIAVTFIDILTEAVNG